MNSSIILTAFVAIGGAFTFWCSFKNYDWFFTAPGPSRLFIYAVGRPAARVAYILFSIPLIGWGLLRIVNPPDMIPTDFIYRMATPNEVDLTKPREAMRSLAKDPLQFRGLAFDNSGWVSFWTRLEPDSTYFGHAVASTTAGPDFHEGFAFGAREFGDKRIGGRIIYFDSDLVSCDNALFSKHPLKSASFAMIICSPAISVENGAGKSLSVFYCRSGTQLYEKLIR